MHNYCPKKEKQYQKFLKTFDTYTKHGRAKKDTMIKYAFFFTRDFNLNPFQCSECGLTHWRGTSGKDEPMIMDLDHRNGKNYDNRIENLRYLCPNCHRVQPTTNNRGTYFLGYHQYVVEKMKEAFAYARGETIEAATKFAREFERQRKKLDELISKS